MRTAGEGAAKWISPLIEIFISQQHKLSLKQKKVYLLFFRENEENKNGKKIPKSELTENSIFVFTKYDLFHPLEKIEFLCVFNMLFRHFLSMMEDVKKNVS